MKSLSELVLEKRWPDDGEFPQLNRGQGLVDMCEEILDAYNPGNIIADVGVARGISAQIFRHYGKVVSVDHSYWLGVREMLWEIPGIEPWEGDSLEAASFHMAEGPLFDLVYLDTCHDEEWVTKEIQAWIPCVKKGGFIGGHDFSVLFPGVQWAVMKVLGGPDHVYSDSSWIKRVL